MRPLALIAAGLAALAVGWTLFGSEAGTAELSAATPAATSADETGIDVASPLATGPVVDENAEDEVERRSVPERAAAEAASVQTEPLGVRVRLEDGTPIPDAEVILLDRVAYDRLAYRARERALVVEAGRPDLLREFGVGATTDGVGVARFQWSGRQAEAWVICPVGMRRNTIRSKRLVNGIHDLVLPEPGLVLRVTGPGKGPLEGVRAHAEHSEEIASIPVGGTEFAASFDRARTVTGSDGLVYPISRGLYERRRFDENEPSWTLVAHALVTGGSRIELDREPDPSDPFEIELPSTGPLVVRLVDGTGSVVHDEQFTVAAMFADGEFDRGLHPFVAGSTVDGRVRFEHVELGRELRIAAASVDREFTVERLAPALASPHEPLVVDLRVADERRLVFRAVDDEGVPLRRKSIAVRLLDAGGETLQSSRTRSASDGTLEVLLDEEPNGGVPVVLEASSQVDREPAAARAGLPARLSANSIGLGDLRFELLPLIGAGRVVDAGGVPVEGAIVTVQDRTSLRSAPSGIRGLSGFDSDPSRLPDDVWRARRPSVATGTRGDGTFRLRGEGVAGPLALDVGFPRNSKRARQLYSAGPVEIALGEQDVELVVVEAGELAVRVSHDDLEGLAQHVMIVLRERVAGHARKLRPRQGVYRQGSLPPVAYDVAAFTQGSQVEIATVEDVRVPPGATAVDRRIEPFDLTDALRVVQITVLAPNGQPLTQWQLFDDRTGAAIPRNDAGQVVVPRGQALRAHLAASRCRPVAVDSREDEITVQLERGIEITLALDALDASLDPTDVVGYLSRTYDSDRGGEGAALGRSVMAQFDSDGRAQIVLPGEGTYWTQFYVFDQSDDDREGSTELTVGEADAGSTLTLVVPEELQAG